MISLELIYQSSLIHAWYQPVCGSLTKHLLNVRPIDSMAIVIPRPCGKHSIELLLLYISYQRSTIWPKSSCLLKTVPGSNPTSLKMNHLAPCRWLPGRTYSSHSESLSHGQTSRGMTNDSPAELVLSSSNVDRAEKEKVPWMSILLAVSSRLWQRRRHRDRCSDLHRTSTSSIHLEIQLRRKFCHHESPQTKNSWIPTHWIAILMKADTTTA